MMTRIDRRPRKERRLDARNLWKVLCLQGSLRNAQRIARRTKDIQTLLISNLLPSSRECEKANLAEESPTGTSSSSSIVRFAGTLTIQDPLHATILAYIKHKQQKYPPEHVVFWVDGSASEEWRSSGAAVVSRRSIASGWSVNGYHIPHNVDVNIAELVAIIKALELVEQKNTVCSAATAAPHTLTIYSDTQFVLQKILSYDVHPADAELEDHGRDLFELLMSDNALPDFETSRLLYSLALGSSTQSGSRA